MSTPAPALSTYLQRLNALREKDPSITHLFIGWMCGSAAHAELHSRSVRDEVERFLTHHEKELNITPGQQ